jgi:hypothetical protein
MPEDEGLPLPPPPRRPIRPPRAEGVPKGFIKEDLGRTLEEIRSKGEKWRSLETVKLESSYKGGSTLERLRSKSEQLSEAFQKGDWLETIDLVGSRFLDPISWSSDKTQAAKYNALLDTFMKAHAPTLRAMSQNMREISRSLDGIAELADNAKVRLHAKEAREVLDKKRSMGDGMLERLDERIKNSKDPAEREKLAASRADLAGWIKERDERIKQEQAEIEELDIRTSVLAKELGLNGSRMAKAAASAEQLTGVLKNGVTDHTAHATPEAALFAASLRNVLIRGRAGIFDTLEP